MKKSINFLKISMLVLGLFLMNQSVSQDLIRQQIESGVTNFRGQNTQEVVYNQSNNSKNGVKSSLNESFESNNFPPFGWTIIDSDQDGHQFMAFSAGIAHTGSYSAASASYINNNPLTPNNHLITPALIPVLGDSLSFWYAPQDTQYRADKFQVLVSTSGRLANDFMDTLWVKTIDNTDWVQKKIDLSPYIGDTIFISFNHFDCTDFFYMKIDDVSGPNIYYLPDLQLTKILRPESNCDLKNEIVEIMITNNSGQSVTGFDIAFQLDYGPFVTETYNGSPIPPFGSVTYAFSQLANLLSPIKHVLTAKIIYIEDDDTTNNLLTKIVESYEPKTIPYFMGFESSESLYGWQLHDSDNDGDSWVSVENGSYPYEGLGYMSCGVNSIGDWLISPCLQLNAGVQYELSSWFRTFAGLSPQVVIVLSKSQLPDSSLIYLKNVDVDLDYYFDEKIPFTVDTSGIYYIGFKSIPFINSGILYLDNFMVDDLVNNIKDQSFSKTVRIFPNPAQNLLNIQSNNLINKIRIRNNFGQNIFQTTNSNYNFTIDLSGFSNGIYYISLETNGGIVNEVLSIIR